MVPNSNDQMPERRLPDKLEVADELHSAKDILQQIVNVVSDGAKSKLIVNTLHTYQKKNKGVARFRPTKH